MESVMSWEGENSVESMEVDGSSNDAVDSPWQGIDTVLTVQSDLANLKVDSNGNKDVGVSSSRGGFDKAVTVAAAEKNGVVVSMQEELANLKLDKPKGKREVHYVATYLKDEGANTTDPQVMARNYRVPYQYFVLFSDNTVKLDKPHEKDELVVSPEFFNNVLVKKDPKLEQLRPLLEQHVGFKPIKSYGVIKRQLLFAGVLVPVPMPTRPKIREDVLELYEQGMTKYKKKKEKRLRRGARMLKKEGKKFKQKVAVAEEDSCAPVASSELLVPQEYDVSKASSMDPVGRPDSPEKPVVYEDSVELEIPSATSEESVATEQFTEVVMPSVTSEEPVTSEQFTEVVLPLVTLEETLAPEDLTQFAIPSDIPEQPIVPENLTDLVISMDTPEEPLVQQSDTELVTPLPSTEEPFVSGEFSEGITETLEESVVPEAISELMIPLAISEELLVQQQSTELVMPPATLVEAMLFPDSVPDLELLIPSYTSEEPVVQQEFAEPIMPSANLEEDWTTATVKSSQILATGATSPEQPIPTITSLEPMTPAASSELAVPLPATYQEHSIGSPESSPEIISISPPSSPESENPSASKAPKRKRTRKTRAIVSLHSNRIEVDLESIPYLYPPSYLCNTLVDYGIYRVLQKADVLNSGVVPVPCFRYSGFLNQSDYRKPTSFATNMLCETLATFVPNGDLLKIRMLVAPVIRDKHFFVVMLVNPFPPVEQYESKSKRGRKALSPPDYNRMYRDWIVGPQRFQILAFDSLRERVERPGSYPQPVKDGFHNFHLSIAQSIKQGMMWLHRKVWHDTKRPVPAALLEQMMNEMEVVNMSVPGQNDNHQCGVFVMRYVSAWLHRLKVRGHGSLPQVDINYGADDLMHLSNMVNQLAHQITRRSILEDIMEQCQKPEMMPQLREMLREHDVKERECQRERRIQEVRELEKKRAQEREKWIAEQRLRGQFFQ